MGDRKKQAPYDKMMIVRTCVLFLAWINQYLVVKGHGPLPFSDQEIEVATSGVITFTASIWSWWKNNDVSNHARRNTQYLKDKGLK